jgi:hypothetical protein
LVDTPNPAPGSRASFTTMRSSDFDASLRRALSSTSSVSSAKPTTTAPSRRAPSVLARMSAFSSSSSRRASPVFLIFASAFCAGR